jgi:hypothetical protein
VHKDVSRNRRPAPDPFETGLENAIDTPGSDYHISLYFGNPREALDNLVLW